MNDLQLTLHPNALVVQPPQAKEPLGRHLVHAGKITNTQLTHALYQQKTVAATVGEILVSNGMVAPWDIRAAIARQSGKYEVDLERDPPDPRLARLAHRSVWMAHGALPWMRLGHQILVATSRPDRIAALRRDLPPHVPDIVPVIATEVQIANALAQTYRAELTVQAETRVAALYSCRHWERIKPLRAVLGGLVALSFLLALFLLPEIMFTVICSFAILCLFSITVLKCAALSVYTGQKLHQAPPEPEIPAGRWPRISVMVPLFKETEIAEVLVERLQKITYPKVLLDVVLVLEEKDTLTRNTLARCALPSWMRIVEVPDGGGLTTKPRALNYALDFCKGDIVGIWDAEDAPAPDQLNHVAARFARAPKDVVCLQGILDYYNPRCNWIARCFTLEYAGWFRVILPGFAKLGLMIPLGGTTLFLKRDKIHEMGGWDAHNVTEDADLGVRIARMGYRTETIATATYEEANCRPWRWVKQRSRWLKGFMVTYTVHMRSPRLLLRDLGLKQFLGFQAFFWGTFSQFLFGPFLWTFWAYRLAMPHPVQSIVDNKVLLIVFGLFMITEVVNLAVALCATSREAHKFLLPWAFTLPIYFPLGTLAGYKALYELLYRPFYWDKTQHGQSKPDKKSAV